MKKSFNQSFLKVYTMCIAGAFAFAYIMLLSSCAGGDMSGDRVSSAKRFNGVTYINPALYYKDSLSLTHDLLMDTANMYSQIAKQKAAEGSIALSSRLIDTSNLYIYRARTMDTYIRHYQAILNRQQGK